MTGDALTGPSNLFHYDEMWNTRQLHAPELPSSNGIASARAIARLYAATVGEVDGHRVLAPDDRAAGAPGRVRRPRPRHRHADAVRARLRARAVAPAGVRTGRVRSSRARAARSASPIPTRASGFGYVMNQMQLGVDTRSEHLVRAVYEALAK